MFGSGRALGAPTTPLSTSGRFFITAVCVAGISAVTHSLVALLSAQLELQWFVLAGLTLLSGSFTVRVPTIPARLSVSETFVFAAAMLFGPAAATVLVVLDSLIISVWQPRTARRPLRVLFNMSAPAIAIWLSAHSFFLFAGISPLQGTPRPVLSLLVPLLAMAVIYFLLNSWLIAGAVAFETRTSAIVVWRRNFLWLSLNFLSGASVAALLLPYLQDPQQSFLRVTGILLPLLLISYLTYKTALGRVEDANKHLNELNQLYLSTIETLAMAIDAKDQITHGHIRRVQQYAVGLAQRMGITDAAQIQAIEAASLLHDMGKLAVPEYILNKPGKLTPAEFERMKLHASVGADILSAIRFPYPVVPIVRHHHENWDGSGYPDGLVGSSIPIGARILSVVDCFDALTSDRPYRPRLSDGEAIRILLQRRGLMYDPLVVDTFIAEHSKMLAGESLRPERPIEGAPRSREVTEREGAPRALRNITDSTEESLVLYELAKVIATTRKDNLIEVVFNHLRRAVPITACVFYRYDAASDLLTATQAAGENTRAFTGTTVARGQRLTGWVAANKQSILNSDPILDLGEVAKEWTPRLRSCLSSPVLVDDRLVGVLTAYSVREEPFVEYHRRIFESAGRLIADLVDDRPDSPSSTARGSERDRLDSDLQSTFNRIPESERVTILLLAIREDQGARVTDAQLDALADILVKHVSHPAMIFRHSPRSTVALLPHLGAEDALHVQSSVVRTLGSGSTGEQLGGMRVAVGWASGLREHTSLERLLASAAESSNSLVVPSLRPPSVH